MPWRQSRWKRSIRMETAVLTFDQGFGNSELSNPMPMPMTIPLPMALPNPKPNPGFPNSPHSTPSNGTPFPVEVFRFSRHRERHLHKWHLSSTSHTAPRRALLWIRQARGPPPVVVFHLHLETKSEDLRQAVLPRASARRHPSRSPCEQAKLDHLCSGALRRRRRQT